MLSAMESQPAPPDEPLAIADDSQRTASDELEQYGSDYAAENMQRSRKRTKFVSIGCLIIDFKKFSTRENHPSVVYPCPMLCQMFHLNLHYTGSLY
jgi:hypothetical protein